MRLSVRIDDENAVHVRLSVFVNGALAGNLCLRASEAVDLRKIVLAGIRPWQDSLQITQKGTGDVIDAVGSPGRA